MTQSENAATSQPAPETAQISDGKSNLSAEQLVQQLLQKPQAAEVETAQPEAEEAPEVVQESAVEEATQSESEPTQKAEETSEEAVVPEESEATAESEDDDVLSHKSALDPKTKDRIQKRIDKEVGKRKALEERAAAAEAKAAELEKQITERKPEVVVAPSADNPLAHIESVADLEKEWKQAKEVARWAEDLLDDPSIDEGVEVGDRKVTKAEVKQIMRNAKRTLEDQIPARARFLQAREQHRQIAYQDMPYLKDKNSPEYQRVQASFKEFPWLAQVPNAEYLIGMALEGEKALAARKAAASKPAPKVAPKPPASQTAPAAAAPKPKTAESAKGKSIDAQIAELSKGNVTAQVAAQIQMLKSQKNRK